MAELSITRHPQGGYLLRADYLAPAPREEVFQFFADALNLSRLTPAWISFQVLTPRAGLRMRQGLLIDYCLRIHGLPIRWQSEITLWDAGRRFVDEQRRGPYRFWRHEHRFEAVGDGTRVIDEVRYDVPGGRLVNALFVRRDLTRIFRYRQQQLDAVFAGRVMDCVTGSPA